MFQPEDLGPLEGVVISVSKKLGVNQTEYNTIVVELGGDYHWQYSASCTHFIFQVSDGVWGHTCLLLRLYRICSRKSSKSIARSGNRDSLTKVPDSLIHEKTTNKHSLSDFSRE